ncbi:hypothetical protein KIN20_024108 [Parelaphostrongylus tenuis]|uniref:Uncharacterized protein n=1 Tax=Parelaphostrongylus tenuis TaxID=148309 RepID=A0AAD5NAP2_PARTN|nr:hypothetical protein KIN20_024108 [Parelaphostrongylus tenuis]
MGAKQSLENQTSSSPKDIVQSKQSSPSETPPSSSLSADVKFDATTSSKHNQITTASHNHEQALPSPSICQSTSESTDSTQSSFEDSSYPFREKVGHLSPDVRKEKYEEEIYRLFQSPHSSHLDRLAPVKIESEEADLTEDTENTEVTWSESQLTFDIGKCALSQRSYKRCNRSKADPWRRYGAIRKLHEIGGTGCTPPNQENPRMPQNFYQIEAGSIPPPPPVIPPITTVEEYGTLDELLTPKQKKSKTHMELETGNNHCSK